MTWRRCRWMLLAAVCLFYALPVVRFDTPLSEIVLSRDGTLLDARVASDGQWRFPGCDKTPQRLAQALVEAEDRRFYTHAGVDVWAVARAVRSNVRAKRVVSGASTLTMQVVRLSRHRQKRTFVEKAVEALLALRLELSLSKQEILNRYACEAPFGGNVVGVQAAAWRYMGRSAEALSWAEAATLAVLPNNPSLVHLGRGRSVLQHKRDALLRRLHTRGVLDEESVRLALLEPLLPKAPPLLHAATHLLGAVKDGHTTLDSGLQQGLLAVLERHSRFLQGKGVRNIAAVVAEVETGKVLAYAGNVAAGLDAGAFVDAARSPRSSGSVLKPFLYASVISAGELLPEELLPDTPINVGGFSPHNADRMFRGAVPASYALIHSLNVPMVSVLHGFGVGRFYDVLKEMGFTTLFRPSDGYGLSLIIGGAEISLWDAVGAYAGLARTALGLEKPVYPLQLKEGGDVQKRKAPFSAAAAYVTLMHMQEVARPDQETYWKTFASARHVAWKTGTSQGFRDGWAIGVTPKHVLGVWVGNADGEPRAGLTGVDAAAPVLFDVLAQLPRAQPFTQPAKGMTVVEVCEQSGMVAGPSCAHRVERWIPASGAYRRCVYCEEVHCDSGCVWRVHSGCASVAHMQHRGWFALPATMEWYFRRWNLQYQPLPPWRSDCVHETPNALALVYPGANAEVYMPKDGTHQEGLVFQAVHQRADSVVHWHVDGRFVADTHRVHQLVVKLDAGEHTVVLVDNEGASVKRRVRVLAHE